MSKTSNARFAFRNPLAGCVSAALMIALVILGLLASLPAQAQVVGASLSGTITDESHGAVPKATVSVENIATGVATSASSNDQGIYSAPNLLPGNYEVTVTAPGFQKAVQNGIVLTVGAQQVLNISLQVGSISQSVQVTTEAPDVQLASSTINGDVSENTISQLPLNGRSWTDLATLQPGVSSIHDMALTTSHDRLGRGLGDQMSIDGGRPQQNNYLLNGVSVNDYSNQAPGTILGENLGADAVAEFTILTSNYSTEYGRSSGGVISAITRSGTNQFHGSAYEYLRNSALDARNAFDAPTIPEFRRNQFGASAGGPIIKDKTFIFGDYEGLRETQGLSTFDTVPSRAARGILPGGTTPTQPAVVSINGVETPLPTTPVTGFAPNPDPVTGIDQAVEPFINAFFPLPNVPGSENGDTGSFSPTQSQKNTINYFTIRVDHKFTGNDSLAGTYMYDKAPFVQPDVFNDVLQSNETRRQVFTAEENHVFSPTLVNSVRFGWSHIYAASPGSATAINPAAASTDPSLSFIPGQSAGTVDLTASGITLLSSGLSTATPAFFDWNSYQIYENLFLTKGIHSLKFGGNFERLLLTESDCGNCGGTYTYGSLSDFLVNNPAQQVIADLAPTAKITREMLFGAYVQDDIRLRPNLTINAGLRYEIATVPSEVNGHISSIHSVDGSQVFTGKTILANPSHLNFEPRVGFSWDPFSNGKTAIRGGFGMFDVQIFPLNLRGAVGAYPFAVSPTSSNLQVGDFPSKGLAALIASFGSGSTTAAHLYDIEPNPKRNYVMQWNLNIQREILPNTTFMIAYVGSRGVHNLFVTDNSNIVLPLAKTSAGYLWPIPNAAPIPSGGTCLDGSTPTSTGCPWPTVNQNFGRVSEVRWDSDSIFHALEIQLSKKMSHGLEAQISYTYGRSEDTSSGSTDGDQFLNGLTSMLYFDKASRRGPSDFDVPHNFVASYSWDIPGPKKVSGFLGAASTGWELSGIAEVSDGTPFTPLIGGDPLGMMGDAFDIADRVPGCNPVHGGFNYLGTNPAQCFTPPTAPASFGAQCVPFTSILPPPPSGQEYCSNLLGDAGRNSIIGPRIVNFDMSMVKNTHVTRISETFNVQFRWEVFNIFNHANFNSPTDHNFIFDNTGALSDSQVGQTSHTATSSRQMQVALKILW